MDTELFELCKDVYGRTGWETDDWYDLDPDGIPEEYLCTVEDKIDENTYIPHYTSDYLLGKLPNVSLQRDELTNEWIAQSPVRSRVRREWSDTPLKALLKLTIALHEAGELK